MRNIHSSMRTGYSLMSRCIHAPNGNYLLYLFAGAAPELILLSALDDALYHLLLTE